MLLSGEFLVIPGLSEEVIIGAATMQKWRIKLDFEHDQALVDPKVARMQLIQRAGQVGSPAARKAVAGAGR